MRYYLLSHHTESNWNVSKLNIESTLKLLKKTCWRCTFVIEIARKLNHLHEFGCHIINSAAVKVEYLLHLITNTSAQSKDEGEVLKRNCGAVCRLREFLFKFLSYILLAIDSFNS